MLWPDRIWIVGCGNMGGAILQAWLDNGAPAESISVIDPNPSNLPAGLRAQATLPDDQHSPDLLLLSVKPNMLGDVAEALAPRLGPDSILISILAGTETEALHAAFPNTGIIVRLMPNMAVTVGKSPMIMYSRSDDTALREKLNALFGSLGQPEWLANEDHMHIVTAVSGSGPAFLFRFIDALAKAGNNLGLDKDQAVRLALAMAEGAAILAVQSEESPGALADKVASPNGTTSKGLAVMDAENRVNKLVHDILKAATDRSIEMAREAKG